MNTETLARNILGLYLPLVKCFRGKFSEREALSLGQFRVLALVHFESIRHVGKLAERNLISQPAMSKMVDSLVRLGYIKRDTDQADRRLIELQVTPLGVEAMSAVYGRAARELVPRLERLTAKQRARIAMALADMNEVLLGEDQ